MLKLIARNRTGNVSIYQVCDQPVFLVFEERRVLRPGTACVVYDGSATAMVLKAMSDTGKLRNFYGSNRFRAADGTWNLAKPANVAQYVDALNFVFAVGPAPLPETDPPGIDAATNSLEDPIDQAHAYISAMSRAGFFAVSAPTREWRDTFCTESDSIIEARGVLRHPIHPDGTAEGWLNENATRLPACIVGRHLKPLFAAIPMDAASCCVLYSYLFACFHKCSLNSPRPLLMVDSCEQGVGKSVTGEAIAVLVDGEPKTLSLDRNTNEGDEIVSILAHGARCLVLPNLAHRRNWTNTLIATLCTDTGQSRRLKYSSKATTFYGTLGITSAVLGAVSLHRDLVSRLWRVALSGKALPSLDPVPVAYAAKHRLSLQAEIMMLHAAAIPYTGRLSTRFPEFERAGCAAYAAFSGLSHETVSELMRTAERARHFYRDEVMSSLYRKQPHVFSDKLRWEPVGEGQDWLRQYDGAHAFGYILRDGLWVAR